MSFKRISLNNNTNETQLFIAISIAYYIAVVKISLWNDLVISLRAKLRKFMLAGGQ